MQIKPNFHEILPLVMDDTKYVQSNEYKDGDSAIQKVARYIISRLRSANFSDDLIKFNLFIWLFANSSEMDVGSSQHFINQIENFIASNILSPKDITPEFNIRNYSVDILKKRLSVNGIRFDPVKVKEKAKDEVFLERKKK